MGILCKGRVHNRLPTYMDEYTGFGDCIGVESSVSVRGNVADAIDIL